MRAAKPCMSLRTDQYMEMNTKRRPGITPWWVAMVSFLIATSVSADEGYRFFYNFASGSSFSVLERSQQEMGGKLISQFQSTVEFRVSQARGSPTPTITARIDNLSNKGRRIDYFDEITFQANISATGEISGYSFSGGLPKHRQLIQAVGPAKRTDIFWMPHFPDRPMKVGDSFSHSVSIDGAKAERVYKLEKVEGHLARFRLHHKGSLAAGAVGVKEISEGSAVFDLEKGM